MREKISVTALKNIGVFYQGDIYDLACLLLKVDDAKDKGTNRKSRYTVHGLAKRYAMIADISFDEVLAIMKRHALPLGATVEHDEDVEHVSHMLNRAASEDAASSSGKME